MIIRVTMKDPDHDLDEEIKRKLDKLPIPAGLTPAEWTEVKTDRAERIRDDITGKWIESAEYLTVDFDTDAKTATVVEVE